MPASEIDISVIVPANNAQKNLPRCLRALQAQSLRARAGMEVIVVDGGSSDRTHEIALEFRQADPAFFRIHRQKGAGPSAARSAGLSLARGKYVSFCDACSWAEPTMCETLYGACEESGAEIAGFGCENIWDQTLGGKLIRRDFLLSQGPYEDEEVLTARCLAHCVYYAAVERPLWHPPARPMQADFIRAGRLAAYDALRQLIAEENLPLFCADWMGALRGICLYEYRENASSAAFYERMITLAGEPQVMEALAHTERGTLCKAQRKFRDAFAARDWIKLERRMRRESWRAKVRHVAGWMMYVCRGR